MNKRTGLIVVALIVGLAVDLAESKTIYVKVGGTGDGSSWAAAFGDLQRALDDADPNDEIWVAAGTYIPTYDYNLDIGDRGKHFEMINCVGIYGGFPDTADPVWADRDPDTWESILSGDLAGNDEPVANPEDMFRDPNRSENCYHVFLHTRFIDIDPNAVLDGSTITGGNANYDYGGSYSEGGGIYSSYSDSLTLEHCTFSGNFAVLGGGVYHEYSVSSTVKNCTFSGNSTYNEQGVGMDNCYSSPVVTNRIFWGNTANEDLQISGTAEVYSYQ